MRHIFHILTAVAAAAIALIGISCTGSHSSESIEETLRTAENALAKGDMTVAQSVARNISDTATLNSMSVTQLGRLSMIFMQLADSLDQTANTETATDIFDRAYRADADSAGRFYNAVEPGRMQFVETMTGNSAARRNPIDISTVPPDSDYHEDFFDHHSDSIPS